MIKKAFTLAEVLITLAIIGVVAALTIPTVIVNYQKHQTVVKLKKIYATFNQIVIMSELENTHHNNWDYTLSAEEFHKKYFQKYFLTLKNYSTLDSKSLYGIDYYLLNGEKITDHVITQKGTVKLSFEDGIIFAFGVNSNFVSIAIDINGTKKPNTYGKDVFLFRLYNSNNNIDCNGKFLPRGFENTRKELLSNAIFQCNKKASWAGQTCAGLIIKDGWQIKNDYPW